jgi:hypothetical protein
MLRSHLIELLCKIESQEQGSKTEARSFLDHDRSAGTVDLNGLCAGPLPIGPTLKSVQKLRWKFPTATSKSNRANHMKSFVNRFKSKLW